MNVLAIELSEMLGSVAAVRQTELIAELALPTDQRSARSLAPTIQQLLASVGWKPADLQLIAVTSGPGSFTSLRIALATAKAMAYALGCDVIGVDTLDALAWTAADQAERYELALDAQREQVFCATFERLADGQIVRRTETQILSNAAWLQSLTSGVRVAGNALRRIGGELPPSVHAVAEQFWTPSAKVVGQLGYQQFLAGRRDDVYQLVPSYLRVTAAEEQWQKRHGAQQPSP